MKKTLTVFRVLLIFILLLMVAAVILRLTVGRDKKPVETKEYVVTFDVGKYGEELPPIAVNRGEKPVLPEPECKYYSAGVSWESGEVSSLPDYEFTGWYLDGELITDETLYAFNRDVTLVAKWRSLWTENY